MAAETESRELKRLVAVRFGCDRCGRRFASHGFCPDCADEPLLDLADKEVRRLLVSLEDSFDPQVQEQEEKIVMVVWTIPFIFVALFVMFIFHLAYERELITAVTSQGLHIGLAVVLGGAYFWVTLLKAKPMTQNASKLCEIPEEEWKLLHMLAEEEQADR
ncbi:MAG: hypothetical protein ACNA8W_05255 [Bradymonadaceae bacterium]